MTRKKTHWRALTMSHTNHTDIKIQSDKYMHTYLFILYINLHKIRISTPYTHKATNPHRMTNTQKKVYVKKMTASRCYAKTAKLLYLKRRIRENAIIILYNIH